MSPQFFDSKKQKIVFFALFLSLVSFSAFSTEPQKITILALGDSTTAGTPGFRSPVEAPPEGEGDPKSQYAYWMMLRNPEYDVLNRGVNGERTDQIFERFQKYTATEHPDAVIVLAGVNDLYQGHSAEEVEIELQKIYALAMQNKMKIVACTILPYNRATSAVLIQMVKVNRWIRGFAAKNGFLFCDTFKIVSDPERFGKLSGSPDGLHPDIAGYRKIGEAWLKLWSINSINAQFRLSALRNASRVFYGSACASFLSM